VQVQLSQTRPQGRDHWEPEECHVSHVKRHMSYLTSHTSLATHHTSHVIRHVTSNDMEPRYCCVSLLPSNTSLTNAAAAAAAASSFFTRSCSKLPLPNFDLRCWLLPMHCESTSNVTLHTPDVKGKKSHATCHTSKVTLSRPFTMIPMRVQSASASSILQIVKP
jgi:hypothetical protein